MKNIEDNKNIKLIRIIIVFTILISFIIIWKDLMPFIDNVIENLKDENAIVEELSFSGIKGITILISFSILQVFSIMIPSSPIRIVAGLSFGFINGYIISLLGFMIGNIIVFLLARRYKEIFHLSEKKSGTKIKKKIDKWDFSFVQDAKNLSIMAFLLFIIPGVPRGIIPYVFANSKIRLSNYLACLVLGSSPALILSVIIGVRMSKSDVKFAATIVFILIIISLIAILMRKKILDLLKKV